MNGSIGYIIGGGLKEGFRVRLTVPADSVQEGSFVVCDSGRYRYFGLVTDLQLGATDPRFADEKTERLNAAVSQALLGKTLYTTLNIYPTLLMDRGPEFGTPERAKWDDLVEQGIESPGPKPVKTVPAHHVTVRLADEADVAQIFGEEGPGMFVVGQTIEQGYPVRLDLNRFVKRSSGIFGATGTGKSFLTRMVLAGLMKEDVAAALVFDMHNEYGFDLPDTDNEKQVLGLKSLFGARVQTVTLGSQTIRTQRPDFDLFLTYRDITTADIQLLSDSLNLTDTTPATLSALVSNFKQDWFAQFMQMIPGKIEEYIDSNEKVKKRPHPDSVEYWADLNNVHPSAATALHNKLMRIYRKEYVVEQVGNDPVQTIVDQLENGRHIVLSFGKHDNDLDYLLVSNILTRKLRNHWVKKTEESFLKAAPPPKQLLIAIEEAHKLLNPQISKETTFGVIARELRKYFVTLLVVDQRPSGIDDEVMSQLGTRITGWLGDEDDIRAVLTGLAGREQLRGMLARLQEKEEVLLLGWGVKMPIPVKSRRYDKGFWDEMKGRATDGRDSLDDINADLFG